MPLSNLTNNFIIHNPILPEEELLIKTTEVYLDEEIRISQIGINKKVNVIVAKELRAMQISYLQRFLPNFSFKILKHGVILLSKDNSPKALVRFYTDLHRSRGRNFASTISNIITLASNYKIQPQNIFIFVISHQNGLDTSFINKTLNNTITISDILTCSNISVLRKFNTLYIDSMKTLLPDPHNQIYFLTSTLHPNNLSHELYKTPSKSIDLTSYPWLNTPLCTVFTSIKSI